MSQTAFNPQPLEYKFKYEPSVSKQSGYDNMQPYADSSSMSVGQHLLKKGQ